jgi:dTDP-4-dehydrorhamnose reductase
MSSWLVTGADGRLGRELTDSLRRRRGDRITAAGRRRLDITDAGAVRTLVSGHDIVVNAAAWTDVERAEDHEADAMRVNGEGVRHLRRACHDTGAVLIGVSTDAVFNGGRTTPYAEGDVPQPVNAYGRSKAAGEREILEGLQRNGYVVRTAWLYGDYGESFVSKVLRRAAVEEKLSVVNDEVGNPTSTLALVRQIVALGDSALAGLAAPGVYHGVAAGAVSRYDLARAIFELAGLDPARIRPAASRTGAAHVPRPAHVALSTRRWAAAGIAEQNHWRDQLSAALGRPFLARLVGEAQRGSGGVRQPDRSGPSGTIPPGLSCR